MFEEIFGDGTTRIEKQRNRPTVERMILEVMADEKWRAVPTIGELIMADYPSVRYEGIRKKVSYSAKRGTLAKAPNPMRDKSLRQGFGIGVIASNWVYLITERGKDKLARYREGREYLGNYGWLLPETIERIRACMGWRRHRGKSERCVLPEHRGYVSALVKADQAQIKTRTD